MNRFINGQRTREAWRSSAEFVCFVLFCFVLFCFGFGWVGLYSSRNWLSVHHVRRIHSSDRSGLAHEILYLPVLLRSPCTALEGVPTDRASRNGCVGRSSAGLGRDEEGEKEQ